MAQSYLDELLALASEILALADAENRLDTWDRRRAKGQRNLLKTEFARVRDDYVDGLLDTPERQARAYDLVSAEIAETRANCDPMWIPALDYVSDDLLPYLKKQAGRDPRVIQAIRSLPWALGVISAIAYGAVRVLSAVPIDHSIDTRAGIQERAAAVEKLIRYDDLMNTRVSRGGWLKGILLWPLEPTEEETRGASEFAALAFEARQAAVQQFGCSAIAHGAGNSLSKEEIAYLSDTAEYLRAATVRWRNPPVLTSVDAARFVGKCR